MPAGPAPTMHTSAFNSWSGGSVRASISMDESFLAAEQAASCRDHEAARLRSPEPRGSVAGSSTTVTRPLVRQSPIRPGSPSESSR